MNRHVFVEKPLYQTVDELATIESTLRTVTGRLVVGFNRRFAPLAQQLHASLSTLHEPKHIHYRVNAGPIPLNHWTQDPEVGGGRVIGEACHFIDFITFLVGEAPISVNAIALPDGGKYREDNVSMTFTFPDGSIGVVDYLANGDKSSPKERVEVFCGGQINRVRVRNSEPPPSLQFSPEMPEKLGFLIIELDPNTIRDALFADLRNKYFSEMVSTTSR